ncbi:MAG: flagellar basal body protein FliL [Alphaproteobacteria bacterium]|nr:flagellar basal body protein FliL [Alphaproteobacteria bacterium]
MAQEPEEDFAGEGGGEAEPEFEGAEGGGGNKKKLLLFVGAPLLLIVLGAAGAYFSGLADPLIAMVTGEEQTEEMAAEGDPAAEGQPAAAPAGEGAVGTVFYDLPEMLVNLNTPGRKRNFLKMRVSLELASEADINRVETVLPRIVDNFQVYLRELRLEDLQGAAGMYRLREELLGRVNAAVRPAQVRDVLFKEMIVQ